MCLPKHNYLFKVSKIIQLLLVSININVVKRKISERKVIIFTAGLIVFAGLIRLLNYSVGIVLFYLAFLPIIIYRTNYYLKHRSIQNSQSDKYRLIVLISIIITIVLNILGIQDVEFFLLFLLMVDFLLVINNKL